MQFRCDIITYTIQLSKNPQKLFINHSGMKSLRIKVSFEESRKELLTQTASKAQGEAQEKTLEFC